MCMQRSRWPVGGAGGTNTLGADTHCGQFLNVLVRRSQRSQTDLLRELSELGVGQQRHVTQQLMTRVTATKRQQKPAR